MSDNPEISIITPFYNAAPWIARCAESLKQQEGPFEFIFIDDFSTDDGLDILMEHTDDRFVILTNPGRKGVSAARNIGLKHATGKWVTFLDADDELMPGAYEMFKGLMRGDMNQANHVRHYVEKGTTHLMYQNAGGMYLLNDLPQAWFGVWNKLYRRGLLEKIRFDEDLSYGEDELFNLECLAKARKIYHGDSITVKHNIENKESLSHIRTGDDMIMQLKKLLDFIAEHKDPELRRLVYDTITVHLSSKWYWDAITK